ncbi:copper resistance CopC family protein [Amycolatopsis taiwanensis]|uniref:Copper resistance protein C n=1 Tax=Amycolatopsis taiwanensis TaxID=342230 RepID=A0A9W6R233_9PSEU|nr:copper resistance CopC family protein [Amycolatopsis taiwanensis]GLY68119.1 copper resistance protein C [Amycolatopsis taiwanensis]
MSYRKGRLTGAVRVIAAAIFSVVIIFALAPPAAAHTALTETSPEDGSQIDTAPSEIQLQFSEAILTVGANIVVQGPDSREYQEGKPQIVQDKVTQPLKPLGPSGEYRVEIRVVADDGHPNPFGMRFTLTKPGPAAGGAQAVGPGLTALRPVPTGSENNAPRWAPWLAVAATLILVSGAVLFGRRATHGLD